MIMRLLYLNFSWFQIRHTITKRQSQEGTSRTQPWPHQQVLQNHNSVRMRRLYDQYVSNLMILPYTRCARKIKNLNMRMEFCKSWHYGNWTVKKMCYIEIDALHP